MEERPTLSEVYSGRTVLVTGHTGFKGGWMVAYLLRLGAKVVGYSLPPATIPSFFEAAHLGHRIHHVEGDVRDLDAVRAVCDETQPDFVFHLAAQSLVLPSYEQPAETMTTNIIGTVSVLEAARTTRRPCVIVAATTDKVYENRNWVHGYRESDPLGGHDPYSASKAAMEIVLASYRRSFFDDGAPNPRVRLASARAGNVIGGGDWAPDRIVPDLVRSLSRGKEPVLRNPSSIRPWQHVLEPVTGYLWLGALLSQEGGGAYADAWNFGPAPEDTRTVEELADTFIKAWGSGQWVRAQRGSAPHEARILKLSIDKAMDDLAWRPSWHFAEAVERTARWYHDTLVGEVDALAACNRDIDAFEEAGRVAGLPWLL